jgi:hypothetical protein
MKRSAKNSAVLATAVASLTAGSSLFAAPAARADFGGPITISDAAKTQLFEQVDKLSTRGLIREGMDVPIGEINSSIRNVPKGHSLTHDLTHDQTLNKAPRPAAGHGSHTQATGFTVIAEDVMKVFRSCHAASDAGLKTDDID